MIRLLLLLLCLTAGNCLFGQNVAPGTLAYYIESAKNNSPLIKDLRNQTAIQQSELKRLKVLYTQSRIELNGEYLFVPIVSKDGGKTSFKWNAQSGNDYYGYDLGESSGHLYAGATLYKPLLGKSSYKSAQAQADLNREITENGIKMESHKLERLVTEQYLLCQLDKAQIYFADSVMRILENKTEIVKKMFKNGISKQSDLKLLAIEIEANKELSSASRQTYYSHLMELNLLCGIGDTTNIMIEDIDLDITLATDAPSQFSEQFRLDSLNTNIALQTFNLKYKPQLNLFVNAGLRTGAFDKMYRHLGWNAGFSFSWTILDGKQRKYKEEQAQLQHQTINLYRENSQLQRDMRIKECFAELDKFDKRIESLGKQIDEYKLVLLNYEKEMNAGIISILDYITVFKNRLEKEKELMLLKTNRQLIVTAYNYWNW